MPFWIETLILSSITSKTFDSKPHVFFDCTVISILLCSAKSTETEWEEALLQSAGNPLGLAKKFFEIKIGEVGNEVHARFKRLCRTFPSSILVLQSVEISFLYFWIVRNVPLNPHNLLKR